MRGHIAKKGQRYYAVIYEGVDPVPANRGIVGMPPVRTRREAERLLAELVKKSHDGDYRAPDRVTLGQYLLERWLPTKQAQLRPSTFESYRCNIVNHVVPAIGAVPLQRLTPEHLDAFYADLLASGRQDGTTGGTERQDGAEHPYRAAQGLGGRGTKGDGPKERGGSRRSSSAQLRSAPGDESLGRQAARPVPSVRSPGTACTLPSISSQTRDAPRRSARRFDGKTST